MNISSGVLTTVSFRVKSFSSFESAEAFVRGSAIDLTAFRTKNGWFAITLSERCDYGRATTLLPILKSSGKIPTDAFVTYGNTYVAKICCNAKPATTPIPPSSQPDRFNLTPGVAAPNAGAFRPGVPQGYVPPTSTPLDLAPRAVPTVPTFYGQDRATQNGLPGAGPSR